MFLFLWDDVYELGHFERSRESANALIDILNGSVCRGEQGVVLALHHVQTWADFCSALSDENISVSGEFTSVLFDAKALTLRISAVLCTTTRFFVCHMCSI